MTDQGPAVRHIWGLVVLTLAATGRAADPAVSVVADPAADAVEFRAGTRVVTRYQYRGTVPAAGGDKRVPLAKPVFYPLMTPAGVPVTRGWPLEVAPAGGSTDHPHHKSVWFGHGEVTPAGGVSADFWTEGPGHGVERCDAVGRPVRLSPTHAAVETKNTWLTAAGVALLTETRTLHVVSLPAGGGHLIGLDLTLTAVVPVTFGDTKEGTLGVRVPDAFALTRPAGGTVTSATGSAARAPANDDLPLWGEAADWHDYAGVVGGKPAGVAVFDHPANRPRAAWHTRAYGLLAANPFGRAGSGFPSQRGVTAVVTLAKGETLRLRYAVLAHDGGAAAAAAAFRAWAD